MPFLGDRTQFGLGRRPEIRADESVERRAFVDGIPLRADVDLLAPVDLSLGQLAARARVTAEMRALHILDREFLVFGQGEEVARRPPKPLGELRGHTGSGEVEEPDIVGRGAQLVTELRGRIRSLIEQREVEHGEVQISHALRVRRVHAPRPECFAISHRG